MTSKAAPDEPRPGRLTRRPPLEDDYTRLRKARAACMRMCEYCARFGVATSTRHGAPVHLSSKGMVLCDALRSDYFLVTRLTQLLEPGELDDETLKKQGKL